MAKQDFRSQADNIKAGFQALFNDASKDEIAKDKIKMIPVSKTDPFRNHPFYVRDDADMEKLVESIREQGIISPIKVRPKADGRYELISGHRRKHACEQLGITEMPALIVDMTDEEATIQMVDANLQREKILPSEKAFAYKMKLDAMKRQGKRNDLTSVPMAQKSQTSRAALGEQVGESQDQIRRYIRLTCLISELLKMTDDEKIPFRTAVELSYLSEPEQNALLELLHESDPVPSLEQATELKRRSKEQPQTKENIHAFLTGRESVKPFELPPLSQEELEEERRIEELAQQTKGMLEQFRRANESKPRSAEDPDDEPDFKITHVKRATEEEQTQQLEQRIRKDLEKLEALYAKQLTPERLIEFRTAYNALLRWFYKEGC